jgi:hypothetical protein
MLVVESEWRMGDVAQESTVAAENSRRNVVSRVGCTDAGRFRTLLRGLESTAEFFQA